MTDLSGPALAKATRQALGNFHVAMATSTSLRKRVLIGWATGKDAGKEQIGEQQCSNTRSVHGVLKIVCAIIRADIDPGYITNSRYEIDLLTKLNSDSSKTKPEHPPRLIRQ